MQKHLLTDCSAAVVFVNTYNGTFSQLTNCNTMTILITISAKKYFLKPECHLKHEI